MLKFEFITPQKIIFGQGRIKEIGEIARDFGRIAFLVTGRNALKKVGILDEVEGYLREEGIEIILFDKVEPEPSIDIVDEGVALSLKAKCDLVIGLGGGSVLDVAKAVAFLGKNLPFIAIPTTAGTGSEVSYNSVITYPERRIKESIRDKRMMAKVAIIDPTLTLSCPREVTIYSGLDALVHLIEGYTSKGANPLTDSLCLAGIGLIHEALRKVVEKPEDIKAREKMSLAALMGGMVLANAGLGAIHGLASSIGGRTNIPHGLICAVLLPWIIEYNQDVVEARYNQIATLLNSESALAGINELLSDLGINPRLGLLGIREEELSSIACNVSGSIKFNPKEAPYEELIKLLKKAM